MSRYQDVYDAWRRDPVAFWREPASAIEWIEAPTEIFAPGASGDGQWFPDAKLNTCFNCVDRHVRDGRGDQPAVIYDAPIIKFRKTITYAELLGEVVALAAVLLDLGVGKGDCVVIYLPMIPRAHVAMLACARIGAVHCLVRGGLAAPVLAARIDDVRPKLLLTASCGIEPDRAIPYKPLIDAAIEMASAKPAHVLLWQRPRIEADLIEGRDLDWEALVDKADEEGRQVECVPMAATDPLLILFTSETGALRSVTRDAGGHLVALAWAMRILLGFAPGEVLWTASDVSSTMGQFYSVYAPFLIGATTICYEDKLFDTLDGASFRQVCVDWNVASLFTSPTTIRAIERDDPNGASFAPSGQSRLRSIFLGGETSDAAAVNWLRTHSGLPVIDLWSQAETGWCTNTDQSTLPFSPGATAGPMPGDAVSVSEDADCS